MVGCKWQRTPIETINHVLTVSANQVGQVFENQAIVNVKAEDQDWLKEIELIVDWQILSIAVPTDSTFIDANKTIENLSAGRTYNVQVVVKGENPELQEEETKIEAISIRTANVTPNQAPTISVSADKTTVTEWETVTLTANASDPDGTVTKIEWFDWNGNKVWTWVSISITENTAWTYTYYAKATDDDGAVTESNHITIKVNEQAPVLDHIDVTAGSHIGAIDDLGNNTYKAWVDDDEVQWVVTITFSWSEWDESKSVSWY